jgi:hypothetical protein
MHTRSRSGFGNGVHTSFCQDSRTDADSDGSDMMAERERKKLTKGNLSLSSTKPPSLTYLRVKFDRYDRVTWDPSTDFVGKTGLGRDEANATVVPFFW